MPRRAKKSVKSENTRTTHRAGNTGVPPARFRRYAFTLNNFTEDELNKLVKLCQLEKGIIAREVGAEGTPHLQGYIEFESQKRLDALKKVNNRVHWEQAIASRIKNIIYCSKDGDVVWNSWPTYNRLEQILNEEYSNITWKPFQRFVMNTLMQQPDHRKIIWIYDYRGNVGKSFLTRYLCIVDNYLICDGSIKDTACMIKEWYENNPDKELKGIFIDIARAQINDVNYNLIEKLKNGIMFSGKYVSGQIILPRIHIICFANEPPCIEELSLDRWRIYEIVDDELDYQPCEDDCNLDENKDDDDILYL